MTGNGFGCLGCLSSFICPITNTNGEENKSSGYKHNPISPTGNVSMIDRHVAEQEQIRSDLTQYAQATVELKQQLYWLVKSCNIPTRDNRCVRICEEISVYKHKTRISNERYMEVKLFVDHQRHKQTMDRRKRISTVMKRDKPLYALIQKEHDTFMDNVNEMDDLNSQMEEEYNQRHPTFESGQIDISSMVESCVNDIELYSANAESGSGLQVTHTNPVHIQSQDTLCISSMQPKYSRAIGLNEGAGQKAEMDDFSLLEASVMQ
jgi:hypothetical protein